MCAGQMIDGLVIFQIAGVAIPTIAVLALFVRLGKLTDPKTP